MDFKPTHTLDDRGKRCPIPVFDTKKKMDTLQRGDVLEILATDPGAEPDLTAWAKRTGNEYMGIVKDGQELKIYIRKAK
jgi:TusA-related sulfurtransferase